MEAHGLTLPSCLASPCGSISDAFGFAGSGATEVPSLWLLSAEDIHLRQARILHFPFLPHLLPPQGLDMYLRLVRESLCFLILVILLPQRTSLNLASFPESEPG